jgi:hypothetical protein
MPARFLLLAGLATWAAAAAATAAEISYIGRGTTAATAVVEDSQHRVREVRIGETLPDVGELKSVEDDEIVFDRTLGEDERQQLKAMRLAAPDIQRLYLRRAEGPQAMPSIGAAALVSGD